MKLLWVYLLVVAAFVSAYGQKKEKDISYSWGLGPSFEVSFVKADEITKSDDFIKLSPVYSPGGRVSFQMNINRFSVQWYGLAKRYELRIAQTDVDAESQYKYNKLLSRLGTRGPGFETGVYAGPNLKVGRHRITIAAGGGLGYACFKDQYSEVDIDFAVQPTHWFMNDKYYYQQNSSLLPYKSIFAVVGLQAAFTQKLKNNKLGITYMLENRWSVTPILSERYFYTLTVSHDHDDKSYVAAYENFKLSQLNASVVFTFEKQVPPKKKSKKRKR